MAQKVVRYLGIAGKIVTKTIQARFGHTESEVFKWAICDKSYKRQLRLLITTLDPTQGNFPVSKTLES